MTAGAVHGSFPAVTLQREYQAQQTIVLSRASEGAQMESSRAASDEIKRKSIMVKFTNEDYLAIREAAFRRGLEMGPMLSGLLAPILSLLREPKDKA